ncbi:hypothetical protein [Streptomyces sp. NRRL S-4]|uniref:hypothetical protein n=1 Tax=Streptomyces sp. NRRL S-4 TaxID=1519471 RepID=UPI000AC27B1C|nr:hypothetical protein [Streptomyces sp. NRRL S-4]
MDERGSEQQDGLVREWPDRGLWGNASNMLLCVLAVAGIGLSGWAFVMEFIDLRDRGESRERISAACGGLIDPDPVLGLNGGTDRVKLSDKYETDVGQRSSGCFVYRVGDPGTTYGHFSMAVVRHSSEPGAEETAQDHTEIDEWGDEPFRRPYRDEEPAPGPVVDHALPHPLGDGGLGDYDEYKVTARAVCAKGGKVSSIEASAVAQYGVRVTAGDRRTLAGLARQAADRAAARTGCRADLPQLPATLPEPGTELGAAETTEGTCAWYRRFLATQERGRLPDRALDAPAGRASDHDACVLAVGESETRRIYPGFVKSSGYPQKLEDVLKYHPWWVKTETYVGDGTRGLRTGRLGDLTELTPGTAGTDSGGTWWASSVCGGRPALHVLWATYPYDRIAADRLETLFRAYVDDATERRGCTEVVLPDAADFARS